MAENTAATSATSNTAPTSSQGEFYLRRATADDLDAVMEIIEQARAVLARDGIPQWQAGRPNRDEIAASIAKKVTYVYMSPDGRVAGTASLVPGPDPNYNKLYAGKWIEPDEEYVVIHRVAANADFKGMHMGSRLLDALIEKARKLGYPQVRIDTHDLNGRMRHLIDKAGFTYVGKILIHGDSYNSRRAYQLLL